MEYKVDLVDTAEIYEYKNNPRDNKQAIQKVADSIKNFGWRVPIVVDKKNVIITGHTRYRAAKLLGIEKVPVHKATSLSKEQISAYRIMDNKSQEFSIWDKDALSSEFQNLDQKGFDLSLTGFNFEEIEKMTQDLLDFEEPDSLVVGGENIDMGELQTSNVRMVSLFLNTETEPKFLEMLEKLRDIYKTDNNTDTVFEAVQICYNNAK
tara:strand:+ start:952 stop:1575 length:624 start_codon:yes stop_codon:yes gene_type:complete